MESPEASPWMLTQSGYSPATESLHAALFTQGNGYLGLRASLEELGRSGTQGLFLAGLYARITEAYLPEGDNYYKKRFVFDEDGMKSADHSTETLVNAPDPLHFRSYLNGELLCPWVDGQESYERRLDLRNGLLTRSHVQHTPQGSLRYTFRRYVSQADHHWVDQEVTVESLEFSGELEVESGIDGRVFSLGHPVVQPVRSEGGILEGAPGAALHYVGKVVDPVHSPASDNPGQDILLYFDMTQEASLDGQACPLEFGHARGDVRMPVYRTRASLSPGQRFTLLKRTAIHATPDAEIEGIEPATAGPGLLRAYAKASFDEGLRKSEEAWRVLWDEADVAVEGAPGIQQQLRFVLYHLIITKPLCERYSVTARTLSGPMYKGCFWWDSEIYLAPFYFSVFPEAGKHLVRYRALTLDSARENARQVGMRGARYAWNTTLTGLDTLAPWLLIGVRQWHINSDIPYAIQHYHRITGDEEFLLGDGLRVMVETARLFLDRVTFNEAAQRYEIHNAGGPNEYHSSIDNNAYTNRMASKHIAMALHLLEQLKERDAETHAALLRETGLTPEEEQELARVAQGLWFPHDPVTGLVEEYDGYHGLREQWEDVGEAYGGPAADYHLNKGLKQPDVLLLIALHPREFSLRDRLANWDLYEKFTKHGSSLSPGVHAWLAADLGMLDKAVEYLRMSLEFDFNNTNGDSAGGVHSALYGSVWMAMVYGFGGLRNDGETLAIYPRLPAKWARCSFRYRFLGEPIRVSFTHESIEVRHEGQGKPAALDVVGRQFSLAPGESKTVPYTFILE